MNNFTNEVLYNQIIVSIDANENQIALFKINEVLNVEDCDGSTFISGDGNEEVNAYGECKYDKVEECYVFNGKGITTRIYKAG